MSPERVDVNVHPTKMDVRFAEAASFFSILTKAVKESLSRREMIPQVSLEAEKKQEKPKTPEVKSAPEPYEKNRASQFKVMEEKKPYQAPAKEKQVHFLRLYDNVYAGMCRQTMRYAPV